MLWILPLEPLEERYTKQWAEWFRAFTGNNRIAATYVDGHSLTSRVETGDVLDASSTNYWKMTQMAKVAQMFRHGEVRSGDRFFTMDLWHPGLETIPYMAQIYDVKVRLYGFLHAGSYAYRDFTEPMAGWARWFERGWIGMCSKVFFGSEWHLRDYIGKRGCIDNGVVTGAPFRVASILRPHKIPLTERKKLIAFPHRWEGVKRPEVFVRLLNDLWDTRQDFEAVIMTGRQRFTDPMGFLAYARFPCSIRDGLSKEAYYDLLGACRVIVSTAHAEYFGYCAAEGVALGCHPLFPNRYSYPELVGRSDQFLYESEHEALIKLSDALDNPVDCSHLALNYDGALEHIFREMES